jgi:hypothetical protein
MIDDYYHELADHVSLVKSGFTKSLFVRGSPGTGKTHNIERYLKGEDYIKVGGHISSLRLFKLLYENRSGKIILLDDLDGMASDKTSLGILKQALDTNDSKVSWDTTREIGLKSFKFTSSLILCLNKIPSDDGFKALMDRSDNIEVRFSYSEILGIMSEIARLPRKVKDMELSPEERATLVDFIRSNSDISTEVSLRTQYKIENYYAYSKAKPLEWRELALNLLSKKDDRIRIAKSIDESEISKDEKIAKWKTETQMSERAFYYYREKYKERI